MRVGSDMQDVWQALAGIVCSFTASSSGSTANGRRPRGQHRRREPETVVVGHTPKDGYGHYHQGPFYKPELPDTSGRW